MERGRRQLIKLRLKSSSRKKQCKCCNNGGRMHVCALFTGCKHAMRSFLLPDIRLLRVIHEAGRSLLLCAATSSHKYWFPSTSISHYRLEIFKVSFSQIFTFNKNWSLVLFVDLFFGSLTSVKRITTVYHRPDHFPFSAKITVKKEILLDCVARNFTTGMTSCGPLTAKCRTYHYQNGQLHF